HTQTSKYQTSKLKFQKEWEDVQRPIMEHFAFPGSRVVTYNPELHGLNGCCLVLSNEYYFVEIDIEDHKRVEDVKFFCVTIRSLPLDPEAEDVDGTVEIIEDVQKICTLLNKKQKLEALTLLLNWDACEERFRTAEELDVCL